MKEKIKIWLKNVGLFITVLWTIGFILTKNCGYYCDLGDIITPALSMTILIVFVWKKISKRFNL